jgi:hypothetical protein
VAVGHRTSNPTRKRGSTGVMLDFMSQRPQCLSRNRKCLSCSACDAMLGRVRTLPPLRIGLLADATMAAGHRTSNPTRKRGSTGVMLDCMSQRPQCLSRNRKCLSRSACDAMLGRVRTLPPLRIGLLADAFLAHSPLSFYRSIPWIRSPTNIASFSISKISCK